MRGLDCLGLAHVPTHIDHVGFGVQQAGAGFQDQVSVPSGGQVAGGMSLLAQDGLGDGPSLVDQLQSESADPTTDPNVSRHPFNYSGL